MTSMFEKLITNYENELLNNLKSTILQNEIRNKQLKHNHQPVKGVVPNCYYCQMYGNIFETSEKIKNFDKSTLYEKLFPINFKI